MTIEVIKELVAFLTPFIAGFITTVMIPLLIKRFAEKKLAKRVDDACGKLDTHDDKIFEELEDIKNQISIMRGKAPKKGDKDVDI